MRGFDNDQYQYKLVLMKLYLEVALLGNIKYFIISYLWMKNVKSFILGLDNIPRYKCHIK